MSLDLNSVARPSEHFELQRLYRKQSKARDICRGSARAEKYAQSFFQNSSLSLWESSWSPGNAAAANQDPVLLTYSAQETSEILEALLSPIEARSTAFNLSIQQRIDSLDDRRALLVSMAEKYSNLAQQLIVRAPQEADLAKLRKWSAAIKSWPAHLVSEKIHLRIMRNTLKQNYFVPDLQWELLKTWNQRPESQDGSCTDLTQRVKNYWAQRRSPDYQRGYHRYLSQNKRLLKTHKRLHCRMSNLMEDLRQNLGTIRPPRKRRGNKGYINHTGSRAHGIKRKIYSVV